ncbi:uncharacterized protein LOC129322303 isoform X2 [Prosopis cineraria]|uniref:uncharacterized protein LOC129322303 isoform X2 n=1 Tax=Prosopis cineraria TaxID=364024 RepID=UPI0024107988|nr:uncharacterized protein LOC129322303 isoform X2 [Prosopis cineraria]
MSGHNNSHESDRHSIKYNRNQKRLPSNKADLSHVNYKPSLSNAEAKQCHKNPDLKSPEILSMAQFISAIGHIWDSASQSLSCVDSKEIVNQDDICFHKGKVLINYGEKKNERAYGSNDTSYSAVTMGDARLVSSSMPANMDLPKSSTDISNERWKAKDIESEEFSFKLGNIYWCMSGNAYKGLKHPVELAESENMKIAAPVAGGCTSIDASTPAFANESDQCNPDMTICDDLSSSSDGMLDGQKFTSLSADYFLGAVHDATADVVVSQTLFPRICSDYHIDSLATCDSASVGCKLVIDDKELLKAKQIHLSDTITDNESKVEVSAKEIPYHSLAKQEHAFSGALAGVCVSLCLHPVDTIKTVIQSCGTEKKSIFHTGKSIVSDRGLPGLYRGITSSIACSAPTSALYTFTYESVKAALLPYLPKEYYSFAHCVAGGCASIATSSIFTPSERIKQQMQVGSHYRNCWFAMAEIISKGGFYSLYAGWGAVLCRNVPHSVVKFYVYERLKQVMSSLPLSARPNTFQTLLCGGLAGSAAAFVTTPFDVIKTRLQTQIPGSVNQYHSVFHALCKIGKNEGVRGLYRGLTPRLIIYMSQGSLFFASYEFFKRLFSLEE